jgi:pimeloyl-ACP methyl ester carboxylesterase
LCGTWHPRLQHKNAPLFAIAAPPGINEGKYVTIGGIEQWVEIRGQNLENPVLLFVHGGAGAPSRAALPSLLSWEKNFTVVYWDQRGAGRTFAKTGKDIAPTLSIDRMTQDGLEVAAYLRTRLHKDKIIVLGHSWGSILGIHMIKKRSDLFAAYIGTGQVGNMREGLKARRLYLLERARAAGDTEAVQKLESIAQPDQRRGYFQAINSLGGKYDDERPKMRRIYSPDFTLADVYYLYAGMAFSRRVLSQAIGAADLPTYATQFDVPVFFFEGENDYVTPASSAKEYFDAIKAPHKEWVPFDSDHFAVFSLADQFGEQMAARVRPFAQTPPATATATPDPAP